MQIVVPSPFISFSGNSVWYRKGDTLTNGDFLYKYKFPIQKSSFFSVSPLLFLKNN